MSLQEFQNEPFLNFRSADEQVRMQAEVAKVQAQLGQDYPLCIGSRRLGGERVFLS